MSETGYKIKRISDGLYSTGGADPKFTKRGKIWRSRGPLQNHIQQVRNPIQYNGCIVIDVTMIESQSFVTVGDLFQRRDMLQAERDEQSRQWKIQDNKNRINRLRDELKALETTDDNN